MKYVGVADKRTISATAWRSFGIPATDGHEWSAANSYLIESSAFSDAQLGHLLHDDVQHGTTRTRSSRSTTTRTTCSCRRLASALPSAAELPNAAHTATARRAQGTEHPGRSRGPVEGLSARLPAPAAINQRSQMATKKQSSARTKFAKATRAKGNTKVGRRAKSTAKCPKKKR